MLLQQEQLFQQMGLISMKSMMNTFPKPNKLPARTNKVSGLKKEK
jgi:hypothetical protein